MAGGGTGQNSTGSSINSAKGTCSWCGNSTDCLAPSATVLTIMERLGDSGAGFRSLTEAIDTTTPAGRMMMQMVGAFAEFERAMLKRTNQGWFGFCPSGRAHRRTPPKADPSTTVRDPEDGFKRPQDGSRRCPTIQSPPCHCLATAGAGLRQIACKVLRQIICKVTIVMHTCALTC
jgi:Resolvase, N terminal domain